MTIWRKFTAFSISFLLLVYPITITNGCGGGEYEDGGYYLFAPELVRQPLYVPFFYAPDSHFYEQDDDSLPALETHDNLVQWKRYFGNQATESDIEQLVYGSDQKGLGELAKAIAAGKALSATHALAKNTAVAALLKNKDASCVNYLNFVHQCAPFVSVDTWEENGRDAKAMQTLIATGKKQYAQCSSPDLKLRYGFQVVRLAHYASDAAQCVQLYDALVKPLAQENTIAYWALAHKAGALKALERYPEAVYLFSRVFDQCPSRRKAAFGSIYFSNEEWHKESLALCKNQEEKNTLVFLASLEKTDYDLPSLQQLYQTSPNAPALNVLLAREIGKAEAYPGYVDYHQEDADKAGKKDELADLQAFVTQCAQEKKVLQPEVWYFSAAYLAYLRQDVSTSSALLKKAAKAPNKDELLSNQIHLVEVMLKVGEAKKLDARFEKEILKEVNWLKETKTRYIHFDHAYVALLQSLSGKYLAQGNPVMAYLCRSKAAGMYESTLLMKPDMAFTQELMAFVDKKGKTDWENFALKDIGLTRNRLIELEGTMLLAQYKFGEAIAKYNQLDSTGVSDDYPLTLPADPFLIHINDCHDCDFEAPQKRTYTKSTFAAEMINFEELVLKDSKNAAQYYFFLGNGYYNMSYYGNAWMAIDYNERMHYGETAIYPDCSKALEYYLKAAQTTKNKEFAAKCYFMASKCEQNAYYDSPLFKDEHAKQPREYFKVLKDNYSSTKYYRQVIDECERFAKYTR